MIQSIPYSTGRTYIMEPPQSNNDPSCLFLAFLLFHRRLFTILVTACLMIIPALSTSFLESPEVMQTFNAGCSSHPMSLVVALIARGILLSLVTNTPFANV